LLTMRGRPSFRRGADLQDLSLTEDGAVLIREGLVDSVGPTRRLENLREARGALEIPVHGCVVMPGFVDNGLRGFVPSKKRTSFSQTRNAVATLLRNCLQYGTTSAELETGGSEDPAEDMTLLRHARKVGGEGDVVHCWRLELPRGDPGDEWASRLGEHMQTVAKRHQARFLAVKPGGGSLRVFHLALRLAHSAGLRVKLIADEETGPEFLEAAVEHGAICVTGPCLAPGGSLNAIASHPTAAVFRPLLDLARPDNEQCRPADFVRAGGAPVLSSGHEELSPGFSMQAAVELAVLRHGMTLEQAVSAATINAAYAAGCGGDRGSLEVGKRADILILNISDYREIPHHVGINYVGMVIRRGAVVFNRTRLENDRSGTLNRVFAVRTRLAPQEFK
jgi:imidazolonepropionase